MHTVFPYNIVSVNFCGTDNSFTIIPGTKYLVYWARFVYDREAYILTNDHVVRNAAYVVVTLVDGNQYNSNVIGKDPINDIAVLRIAENLTGPLKLVEFGNSSNVRVGERVFAIGNPYGLTL